jgi:restriction system protein
VQCKQWHAQQVGVTIVRELYGVMAAEGATGGYRASGRFTKEALQYASSRNIDAYTSALILALRASSRIATIARL